MTTDRTHLGNALAAGLKVGPTTDTQASVAAALMQAAEMLDRMFAASGENSPSDAILALIPPDAMAALEAVKVEARSEAEADVSRLMDALDRCLEWMEQTRACGDSGNWEWADGDPYSHGSAVMEGKL